jgi:hypothetical protein
MIVKEDDLRLYNLKNDLAETTKVAADQPGVAGPMRKAIGEFRQTAVAGS